MTKTPQIISNISDLKELMQAMTDLDDPSYLAEQGILLEEVDGIKEALRSELAKYGDQVQSYIEYKLKQRQENLILSTGIADQIKVLSERKQAEDRKIANADKWIDYICQFAGITGLKTPMGEIKYTGGDKMKITEEGESLLPKEMKTVSFTITPENDEQIEVMRARGYTENVKLAGLTELKKWYKTLSEEQKKEFEGKIWIDDSKSISIK